GRAREQQAGAEESEDGDVPGQRPDPHVHRVVHDQREDENARRRVEVCKVPRRQSERRLVRAAAVVSDRRPRQRVPGDVRPPRDRAVLRPMGRPEAAARAIQEGQDDQRVQGAVVQRVGQQGHRDRAQHHPRHLDGAEGTQRAGGAAEVAGLAGGVNTRRAPSESAVAWLFVAPALLVIGLVVAFPLVYSLWLSFTDVNLLRATGPAVELGALRIPLFRWIGARNYTQVLADPLYWDSLWRTLYFVGAFVAEAAVVGFAMALVLNERFPGRPLLRSLLLVPW